MPPGSHQRRVIRAACCLIPPAAAFGRMACRPGCMFRRFFVARGVSIGAGAFNNTQRSALFLAWLVSRCSCFSPSHMAEARGELHGTSNSTCNVRTYRDAATRLFTGFFLVSAWHWQARGILVSGSPLSGANRADRISPPFSVRSYSRARRSRRGDMDIGSFGRRKTRRSHFARPRGKHHPGPTRW